MPTPSPPNEPARDSLATTQYRLALLLACASGAAALGHEVLLSRRLIDVLGASNTSISRVFGCFFLGLALGAMYSSSYLRRIRNAWRGAALAELGVALFILPALCVPWWTDWIWPTLGAERLSGWAGNATKLGLSLAVIFPPAFCMGMFLPCLSRAVLQNGYSLQRHGVWLYAVNTLGGLLGIILVSTYLLQTLGGWLSMLVGGIVNATVAVVCWTQAKRTRELTDPQVSISSSASVANNKPDTRHAPAVPSGVLYLLSGLSGFGILVLEMLTVQFVSLSAPLSFYAAPTVLAVVVLCLATSAAVVPWLLRRWRIEPLLWSSVMLSGVALSLTPFWFRWLMAAFPLEGTVSLAHFLGSLSLFCALAIGPPLLAAGLIFPLLTAWLGEQGDARGVRWGYLLACNGLGGLIGAELAWGWVLPNLGLYGGLAGIAVCYAVVALLLGLGLSGRSVARSGARGGTRSGAAFGLVTLTSLGTWWLMGWPHLTAAGIAVLDERAGREGIVSVIHSDALGLRIAVSGQYVLGGTKYRYNQQRMAHIPLLLHPRPQSVGFIGLATGISAGAVLEHEVVESLEVAELAPLVVRAADEYFRPYNHQVTDHERATIVIEDGRTFIAARPRRFDVVIGDLFLPWAPGEARLYSVEHFASVRASLKPGGVYCQWLAAYQLTTDHLALIQQTFQRVFPEYHLFRLNFDDVTPAIGLVGFEAGDMSWSTIEARCQQVRSTGEVLDPWVRHRTGLGMLYLGKGSVALDGQAINTMTNMRFELTAGEERVSQREGRRYLVGDHWLHYIHEDRLPALRNQAELYKLAELAQQLTLAEIGNRERATLSPAELDFLNQMMQEVSQAVPATIRHDPLADWEQWHGSSEMKELLRAN